MSGILPCSYFGEVCERGITSIPVVPFWCVPHPLQIASLWGLTSTICCIGKSLYLRSFMYLRVSGIGFNVGRDEVECVGLIANWTGIISRVTGRFFVLWCPLGRWSKRFRVLLTLMKEMAGTKWTGVTRYKVMAISFP